MMSDNTDAMGEETDAVLNITTVLSEREELEAVYRHVFMGETQADVGDVLGVSKGTVGNVVRGARSADADVETAVLDRFTDDMDPRDGSEGREHLTAVVDMDEGSEDVQPEDSEDSEPMTDGGQETDVVETVDSWDEVPKRLSGREVTLVYDSKFSEDPVEFSGELTVTSDFDFSVMGWDKSRNVHTGHVRSVSTGRELGSFIRLDVHGSDDSDDTEGGEDGRQSERDTIQADITEQHHPGHRLAEPSADLSAVVSEVAGGDHVDVQFRRKGHRTNAAGVVESVEGRDVGDGDSIDIRFGDGCFLHINAGTGDYYFQDRGRESPADGWQVLAVTLDPRE